MCFGTTRTSLAIYSPISLQFCCIFSNKHFFKIKAVGQFFKHLQTTNNLVSIFLNLPQFQSYIGKWFEKNFFYKPDAILMIPHT